MTVVCEGQLLLLSQPADGPIPEPTILGAVPGADMLVDDTLQQAPENGGMRPPQPVIQEETGDEPPRF